MCSHFLFHEFLLSILSIGNFQSSHPVHLCLLFYHPVLQQFSISSPFSSLPTSHQISPVLALWLKPFSIWTNTSKQSPRNRPCSPVHFTAELTAPAVQKSLVCALWTKNPKQLGIHKQPRKIAEITILFSWSGFGVLEPPKLQSSASLAF